MKHAAGLFELRAACWLTGPVRRPITGRRRTASHMAMARGTLALLVGKQAAEGQIEHEYCARLHVAWKLIRQT